MRSGSYNATYNPSNATHVSKRDPHTVNPHFLANGFSHGLKKLQESRKLECLAPFGQTLEEKKFCITFAM